MWSLTIFHPADLITSRNIKDLSEKSKAACNQLLQGRPLANVSSWADDMTHTDKYGRPSLRMTYRDHDDDLATALYLRGFAEKLIEAAGPVERWSMPVVPGRGGPHLLGTCRMGDDPATSVVDRYHRSHDVSNLFICDGSSMVTSGRGQPTMTIMALAFRAAEHIAAAAGNNEI